jgi:hypothetical protein
MLIPRAIYTYIISKLEVASVTVYVDNNSRAKALAYNCYLLITLIKTMMDFTR